MCPSAPASGWGGGPGTILRVIYDWEWSWSRLCVYQHLSFDEGGPNSMVIRLTNERVF